MIMRRCWALLKYSLLIAVMLLTQLLATAQLNDVELLQRELTQRIPLTRVSGDRRHILTRGAMLVLEVNGLVMYSVASPAAPTNTYKKGRISFAASDAGKNLFISLTSPNGAYGYPQRKFVAGERCWMTDLVVHKDSIVISLYDDQEYGVPFYGKLKISFMDTNRVPDTNDAFGLLQQVGRIDLGASRPQETVSAPRETQTIQNEQADTGSIPVLNEGSGGVSAIAWGMQREQVIAILGNPSRHSEDSLRQIYYYDSAHCQITFVGGVVSDVASTE